MDACFSIRDISRNQRILCYSLIQKGESKGMARTWHLFPGSNTADGFVGFFDDLRKKAARTVILKGGPGVGKSTLMASVGKHYERLGMEAGYYHCSGDPDSLDAVFIPKADFLVMDGTAPHIIDPILPGARDGILNLGECLDEAQLAGQAEEIEALTRQISGRYAQATRYLRAALAARQDAAAVYDEALSSRERGMLLAEWTALLPQAEPGDSSHCFAQAITWKGCLQETDAVITCQTYCLDVPWGFDADALLRPVWDAAESRGIARTAFHDPLDARKLLHVTAGGAAFTTAVLIDAVVFAPVLEKSVLRRESSRLTFDRAVHDLMRNQAIEALAQAKRLHDALERYYIDAMDYARLDEIKAELMKRLP